MTAFLQAECIHDHPIRRRRADGRIAMGRASLSSTLAVLTVSTQDSDPKQQNAERI